MDLAQIMGAANAPLKAAQKFMPFIVDTCDRYQINTPIRQLCFLAQVGHESGGLFYTEELASGKAYEGRPDLGNTVPGDGVRFKGRGLIQITGRANYGALSTALGADFIDNPTLLGGRNVNLCTPDQLKYAALSAGWYWNSRNLNAVADKIDIGHSIDDGDNLSQFKLMTRRINGGLNGIADRLDRFKKGVQFFVGMPA
ncbi:Predicted chitinase [Cnuella takakiae]|uniref:Predicted chitinase n=1 Tax=Cnuella takakiae TaxID=1302690 RepID=A0A1M5DDP2_9BACT|nr:glycoside hydrolase family 19 protein [Cnuella takakiae]OLY94005.1 hypothetical protein BUE76_20540 [Cnuella takakiae]SHF65046.1 Predicted chitinase [Cnuella takakiae]